MDVQININCDNAAFGEFPAEEISRILKKLADDGRINSWRENDKINLFDFNGNPVGEAKFTA